MSHLFDWRDYTGMQEDKFFKSTMWQGEQMLVGVNCLEPGQTQKVHAHEGADKIYIVLEGSGDFTVGEEQHYATGGSVIVAPAGTSHGVKNSGADRLSLLVAIAPPPK